MTRFLQMLALVAVLVTALTGCAAAATSAQPQEVEALVRRALTVAQEPFMVEAPVHPREVRVADISADQLVTMRTSVRPTLAGVYQGSLLDDLVARLEPLFEPGRDAAPFVTGFGISELNLDSSTASEGGTVVTGRAKYWLTRPETGGRRLEFGETFRYRIVDSSDGWRVVTEERRCLPAFCP